MTDDGFEIGPCLESPTAVRDNLTPNQWDGLIKLAKRLEKSMMDDPAEYGYGRSDFDGTDEEYEAMLQGHRDYGRLADMDSFTIFKHPDGRMTVRAIMNMSHVDRYHLSRGGRWKFEGP